MPCPTGVDQAVALLAYEGAAATLVAALKYRNARRLVPWLADALAEVVSCAWPGAPDQVTWAPTVAAHRRRRGFDQAELLAVGVARRLGVAPVRLLARHGSQTQTGRGQIERAAGPKFVAVGVGRSVLLVDDVMTTGSTASAAAAALRAGGATAVSVAVVAHRRWRVGPVATAS